MSKRNVAGALSYAHLAGVSAKAEGDDDEKKKKDEAAAASEKDDNCEDGDEKKKDAKADDGDDKDEEMADSGDDKTDEKDDDKKGKKSARRVTLAERDRWSQVMASRLAGRNLPLACRLLASTDMPAEGVLATLKDTVALAAPSRDNPDLGPNATGGGSESKAVVAASWDNAFAKTGKKTRR